MCHDTNLLCYTSWNIVRLNALTNHKHAISFLRSRGARARSSRLLRRWGRTQSFTIIVDNVQYPLVDIYPGRVRFLKGFIIETGREVIDVERL